MGSLTRTGTVLVTVFAVILVALLAELTYVLWRRRRFRRRTLAGFFPDASSGQSYDNAPSKGPLYYLFWKNQCRVEPASNAPPLPFPPEAMEEDVAAKWQMGLIDGSYGPSRVLFTIEEEEREGSGDENTIANDGLQLQVVVTVCGFEATPFSTPCASPPYYTPPHSPSRDGVCTPEK